MAHYQTTESRVPCDIEGCSTSFARVADMRRHVNEVHGGPKRCPEPDCNWRGAKRDDRLEDHKIKAHPEIYTEIVLEVPEGFGTPSPQILPQVPQHEGSTGGAASNSYFGLSEGSGLEGHYSNDSLPEPPSVNLVTPNNPGVRVGSLNDGNELLPASWDPPMSNDHATFEQNPRYQSHQILPSEGLQTSLYPPHIYNNSPESMVEGISLDNSGPPHLDGGKIRDKGDHRPWS